MVASVPASVAAFHLAMGPDGNLYVTGPTLTARDHVYRVSLDGKVEVAWSDFGRPQGLAFGPDGALYIVEALSGASGLYRVELESAAPPQLVLSGAGLVGVAFDPLGGVVVASNDTAWRLEELTLRLTIDDYAAASFFSSDRSPSILPAPSTTEVSGSSAICTGSCVSSAMRRSRLRSIEPPPVIMMPRS